MNITAITTLYRLLKDDAPKNDPMEAFEEIISRMNDTGNHDQPLDEKLISIIHEYAQRRFNEGFVAGYDGAMKVFYSNLKRKADRQFEFENESMKEIVE